MGVKGLHRYIENCDLLKNCCFGQSKLIIDGSTLFYWLYFGSHLDRIHGGDYNYFEETVTLFFNNLRKCDIEPYVVLDGGFDTREKKFDTMKRRCQSRIQSACNLSRGRSGEILPILIKNVLKQVLRNLRVPFIQCLAETDWEAAALANEWNCPVLSSDSDFYIFGNRGGFLPHIHFQWSKVNHHKSTGKKFIYAKWYGFKNLCDTFNQMNKHLLPLFAAIHGNDYIKIDKRTFPDFTKFSRFRSQIDGLLTWLSQFSEPEKAIDALLGPVGINKKSDDSRIAMIKEIEGYKLKPSSIAQFFVSGKAQSRSSSLLQNLPDWTLKPLAEGKLASSIIAVLTQQKVIINFQVEDFELSSSSNTSQGIREITYGLLLCTERWQKVSKDRKPADVKHQYNVEEYDRQKTRLTSSMVRAVLPRCVETQLCFDSLWETPQDLRRQVMLEALDVSPIANSLHVPVELQLAVYVTCFWLKQAKPEPKAEILWALLTGFVYGHLCREQQPEKKILKKILEKLNCYDSKTVDLELAHAFSQWQCCLKDSFTLNQLLNHPVPEPELARLYCGSLVHGVAHELKRGTEPESFLAGSSVAISLYQNLQAAVEHELDDDFIARLNTRTWQRQPQESVEETSKAFQNMSVEAEKKESHCMKEDKVSEKPCSTRPKTKRRASKSKRKKRNRVRRH